MDDSSLFFFPDLIDVLWTRQVDVVLQPHLKWWIILFVAGNKKKSLQEQPRMSELYKFGVIEGKPNKLKESYLISLEEIQQGQLINFSVSNVSK